MRSIMETDWMCGRRGEPITAGGGVLGEWCVTQAGRTLGRNIRLCDEATKTVLGQSTGTRGE